MPRIEALRLEQGWESATSLPCWSIGSGCSLTVKLAEGTHVQSPGTELELNFALCAFVPKSKGCRRFVFVVDGVVASTHYAYLQKVRTYRIGIPSDVVRPEGLRIHILTDDAPSPAEAGESPDVRRIGIYLAEVSLTVRPANAAPKISFIEAGRSFAAKFWPAPFSTDPWNNTGHLVGRIRSHIQRMEPASFVRFGDGEGRIFAYPDWLSGAEILHEVIRYQFGPYVLDRAEQILGCDEPGMAFQGVMTELRHLLEASLRNADGVGLPTAIHFSQEATAEKLNGYVGFASALINGARIAHHLRAEDFFDTFAFRGVSRKGGFNEILKGLPFLGIVYHTDVGDALRKTFDIRRTSFFKIPSHHSFKVGDGEGGVSHFPEAYRDMVKSITVPSQGSVFLVGAGYLGKVYCDVIKARGGIALDVGSVLDEWTGLGRTDVSAAMRLPSFRPH